VDHCIPGGGAIRGPIRALTARNSYVERHPIFQGSVLGRYSTIRRGLSWSSRNRAAHATPEETGCENNLVPGPLYGGSPVHVRSFTMVGCWDGRQVTAPPSLGIVSLYNLGRLTIDTCPFISPLVVNFTKYLEKLQWLQTVMVGDDLA
jgi:hypothetical protein